MKSASTCATDQLRQTKTVLSDQHGVKVSITNGNGETRRYEAQSVTLQIVRGGIEILHDHGVCYAWFERCRLEARAGSKHLVLGLASGVVSSCGKEMTIVATANAAAARRPKIFAHQQAVGSSKAKPQSKSKPS